MKQILEEIVSNVYLLNPKLLLLILTLKVNSHLDIPYSIAPLYKIESLVINIMYSAKSRMNGLKHYQSICEAVGSKLIKLW